MSISKEICIAGKFECVMDKAICKVACDKPEWKNAMKKRNNIPAEASEKKSRDIRILKKMYYPIKNPIENVLNFRHFQIVAGMKNREVRNIMNGRELPVLSYQTIGDMAFLAYHEADRKGKTTRKQQSHSDMRKNLAYGPRKSKETS